PWIDRNEGSVVLRAEFGGTSFLLTGDAEAGAEAALVARYGDALASTVVKVGHHGSRTSSTAPFVAAASDSTTAFAVVSVAARNRYGLPDEEPLARWAAAGAAVHLTAEEGAVWPRSDGVRVERVDWRRGGRAPPVRRPVAAAQRDRALLAEVPRRPAEEPRLQPR